MPLPFSFARLATVAVGACATALLVGCASSGPAPLYHWGNYTAHSYDHLRQAQPAAAQLARMQQQLDQAASQSLPMPPGFYAHMGWLHAQLGQRSEALQAWQREQQQFPESAAYLQTLMARSGLQP